MHRFGIGIFLLTLAYVATVQAEALDAAIQAQLDNGQPVAAWNLAQQHLAEHAGNPDFDFAAGLAALEAGQPQHAVMALERVLMVQPSHHRARLELARAYFMLGDFTSARREFQAVQTAGPPPNVLMRVDSFLTEIEHREAQGRTSITGYVELRPGWDSNVASATADSTLVIPALGTVNLGASNLETSDRFLDKNAGITLVRPIDKRRALFADLAYRDRGYVNEHDYSSHSITLSGGLALADGHDRLKLPVQYQAFFLADNEYRRLLTLGAEWSRDLNTYNQLQAFGQFGSLRYPEDPTQDVNILLAGGGWNHRYTSIPLLASIAGYLGDESAQASGGDPNGRLYYGLRLGMQWNGIPAQTPYASLVWQQSRYDAVSPVFLQTRDDRFVELRLGWSWQPKVDWTLTAEASAIDNQSNLGLYEYTRNQFSVGVRYQFD